MHIEWKKHSRFFIVCTEMCTNNNHVTKGAIIKLYFFWKNSYISVGSSSYTNNHSGSISYTGPAQKVQLAILIFLKYFTSLSEIPTKFQNLFES